MGDYDYLEVIKIGKRSILCLDRVSVYDKNVCVTGVIKNIEFSGIGDTAREAAENTVKTVRDFLAALELAVEEKFANNVGQNGSPSLKQPQ